MAVVFVSEAKQCPHVQWDAEGRVRGGTFGKRLKGVKKIENAVGKRRNKDTVVGKITICGFSP